MQVLLIGGNGFIGTPLTHQRQTAGHENAVFHRGTAPADMASDVLQIQGDRNRLARYRDQVGKFAPDVIVDFILSSGNRALRVTCCSPLTRRNMLSGFEPS